ncbi:MAG TPA: alpha/beta hydrolase [Nocardioidaceae bacterium]|nr:alpha/beta hydrolase [Nocardioidaceae bacterium]
MSGARPLAAEPLLAGRAGPAPDLSTWQAADGTVLALRDEGPRDAKVTLVLVHGWTLDHTMWDDVADVVREERPGVRVIAYDHRGHGRSDAGPGAPTHFARLTQDLVELVTELAPTGKLVIAGHSLGGMVLMQLFADHPGLARDRVAGIGLVATSAGQLGRLFGAPTWLVAPLLGAQKALWRRQLGTAHPVASEDPATIARGLRLMRPKPDWSPDHVRRTAEMIARSHPATTAAIGAELIDHDRLPLMADMVGTPTTILGGRIDLLCPPSHSKRMARAVPGSRLVVYPGAGHMLPYERTNDVARELVALIDLEGTRA